MIRLLWHTKKHIIFANLWHIDVSRECGSFMGSTTMAHPCKCTSTHLPFRYERRERVANIPVSLLNNFFRQKGLSVRALLVLRPYDVQNIFIVQVIYYKLYPCLVQSEPNNAAYKFLQIWNFKRYGYSTCVSLEGVL